MGNEKRTWFLLGREKPDAEIEDTTPTLKYFFKLLWRRAAKLLTLNLMMVFQVLPLVVAVLVYFFGATTPTVEHAVRPLAWYVYCRRFTCGRHADRHIRAAVKRSRADSVARRHHRCHDRHYRADLGLAKCRCRL